MAEKKNGNAKKKPLGHADEHNTHAKHSTALEALACAATCIKECQACCAEAGDGDGHACCEEQLALVLDAVEINVAHMRKCCGKTSG